MYRSKSAGGLRILFMRCLFVLLSSNSQTAQRFLVQVLMGKRHLFTVMEKTQEVFLWSTIKLGREWRCPDHPVIHIIPCCWGTRPTYLCLSACMCACMYVTCCLPILPLSSSCSCRMRGIKLDKLWRERQLTKASPLPSTLSCFDINKSIKVPHTFFIRTCLMLKTDGLFHICCNSWWFGHHLFSRNQ